MDEGPDELPLDSSSADELPLGDEPSGQEEEEALPLPAADVAAEIAGPAIAEDIDAPSVVEAGTAVRRFAEVAGAAVEADVGRLRSLKDRPPKRARGRPKKAPVVSDQPQPGIASAADTSMQIVPFAERPPVPVSAELRLSLLERARVQSSAGKVLQVRRRGGFLAPASFAVALFAAGELGKAAPNEVDLESARVGESLLGASDESHVISAVAAAQQLDIDRKKLRRQTLMFASAVNVLGTSQAHWLQAQVLRHVPREAWLQYLEFAAHDETPMRVGLKRGSRESSAVGSLGETRRAPAMCSIADGREAAVVPTSLAIVSRSGEAQLQVKSAASPQKVIQSALSTSLIVKIRGRISVFRFWHHCPLSVVENTKAPSLRECQLRLSPCPHFAAQFVRQTRSCTTDAYSANFPAEAGIAQLRGPPDQSDNLHLLCDVHKGAGVCTKTFDLIKDHVPGMLNAALSLRQGAAMARFRRCVGEEIQSRLAVLPGRCSPSATEHKRRVLQLFCSHGASLVTKRLLLAIFPNGDWRSERIEHHVGDQDIALLDRAAIAERMTIGILVALAASSPRLYPRSRWTGADIATDNLGLMESVHRLLSTSYFRFVATFMKGARRDQLIASVAQLRLWDRRAGPAALEDDPDDGGQADDGDTAVGQARGEKPAEVEGEPVDPAQTQQQSFAVVNAVRRKKGTKWISEDPLGLLIMQRYCLEPMRQYMAVQFERASEKWVKAQEAKMAMASLAGNASWHSRQYRVAELASGEADVSFRAKSQLLLKEPGLWQIVPPHFHTVSMRCLAFRLVSRMICSHHLLLASAHKRFPARMFLLLRDADLADELKHVPSCVLGTWATNLRLRFPELQGDEFWVILAEAASGTAVDTSQIEAKHATVRRLLVAGSHQTHTMDQPVLSAKWLLSQHRIGRAKRSGKAGASKKVRRGNGKKKSRAPKMTKRGKERRRPRAGTWRAFVRLTTAMKKLGHRPNLRDIGAEYRDHKRARTALYLKAMALGDLALRRAKMIPTIASGREPAFGPRLRDIEKDQLRSLSDAMWQRTAAMNKEDRMLAVGAKSLEMNLTLGQSLAQARRVERLVTIEERAQAAEADAKLAQWSALHEGDVDDIKGHIPELASTLVTCSPSPDHMGIFTCATMDVDQVVAAVAWATENGQTSSLGTALSEHWEARHQMLEESECPNIGEVASDGACFLAGMCLCKGEGIELSKKLDALLLTMRGIFRHDTRHRALLASGHIVMRLIGKPAPPDEEGDIDLLDLIDQSLDEWWHIGLNYFKPFFPTCLRVSVTDDHGELHAAVDRLYIKPDEDVVNQYELMQRYVKVATLSVQFYELEDSERRVARFLPQPLPILKLRGMREPHQVWPKPKGAASKKKPRPEPAAEPDEEVEETRDDVEKDSPEGGEVLDDDADALVDLELEAALLLSAYDVPPACPIEEEKKRKPHPRRQEVLHLPLLSEWQCRECQLLHRSLLAKRARGSQ